MKKHVIIDCYLDLDDLIMIGIASKKAEINLIAICATLSNSYENIEIESKKYLSYFHPLPEISIDYSDAVSNIPYITHSVFENIADTGSIQLRKTNESSLDFLKNILLSSSEKITLVATGNLNKYSNLIKKYPEIKSCIEKIVIAGGAYIGGDITPSSEYSIHQDSHSANFIFECGIPIVLCGLDVIHKAIFSPYEIDKFAHFYTTHSKLIFQASKKLLEKEKSHWEFGGISLYGATALAYLICPDMFIERECYAAVETCGALTLGQTVIDFHEILGKENNCLLLTDINHNEIIEFCINTFRE
ncbi:MAG: nucleoside hydrolase [Fusobacteria bacterium]|nr:nucleoside hydrolase [Fusobacteriota bacterium]